MTARRVGLEQSQILQNLAFLVLLFAGLVELPLERDVVVGFGQNVALDSG